MQPLPFKTGDCFTVANLKGLFSILAAFLSGKLPEKL
jgi:hypothetical protein